MVVLMRREDMSFWEEAPDPLPCPPPEGRVAADVAIVGGGFTGLSAAYHLAAERPDLEIALVESHVIGGGASGRNTGILRPGVGGSILDLCRRFGEAEAARLYQASIEAIEHVRQMIRAERLACDFETAGHVKAALTAAQARRLRDEAHALARLGFAAEYLDRSDMAAVAPTPYLAGLRTAEGGQLNPAKLCRELKRVVIGRGVRVYENSPVRSITPGGTIQLELPSGTLDARRVILGTNAYTPRLGLLRGQIIPIQTHVGVTEPLTPAQLSRLTWAGRDSFSDKRRIFNYFRLTRDDRIVFGGGRPVYRADGSDRWAGITDVAEPEVWRRQRHAFVRTFPMLSDVAFVRQWAGTVGMTLDELPVIGESAAIPGVFVLGGWSGHGVALAAASGTLAADLVLRPPSDAPLPWIRNRAPRVPPDPWRRAGLSAYLTSLELADRLGALRERLTRRRPAPAVTPAHPLS